MMISKHISDDSVWSSATEFPGSVSGNWDEGVCINILFYLLFFHSFLFIVDVLAGTPSAQATPLTRDTCRGRFSLSLCGHHLAAQVIYFPLDFVSKAVSEFLICL